MKWLKRFFRWLTEKLRWLTEKPPQCPSCGVGLWYDEDRKPLFAHCGKCGHRVLPYDWMMKSS